MSLWWTELENEMEFLSLRVLSFLMGWGLIIVSLEVGGMIFLNDGKNGTEDEGPDTALISSPAWCLIPFLIFATAESVLRLA